MFCVTELINFIISRGFLPITTAAAMINGTVGNTGRTSPTAPIRTRMNARAILRNFKIFFHRSVL